MERNDLFDILVNADFDLKYAAFFDGRMPPDVPPRIPHSRVLQIFKLEEAADLIERGKDGVRISWRVRRLILEKGDVAEQAKDSTGEISLEYLPTDHHKGSLARLNTSWFFDGAGGRDQYCERRLRRVQTDARGRTV